MLQGSIADGSQEGCGDLSEEYSWARASGRPELIVLHYPGSSFAQLSYILYGGGRAARVNHPHPTE